jgi:hypothetical protein
MHDRELQIGHDPAQDHAHEDPYIAVRDAFDAAKRRLANLEGRLRDQQRQPA